RWDEMVDAGAMVPEGAAVTESWLGVPIPAGDRIIGIVSIAQTDADKFTDADERLVSTLAASMGVALENARLFAETKRLLAETDERAAELAVINEIGTALAQQLDFEAICEVVGERVRSIFRSPSVAIVMWDPATNVATLPYE